MTIYVLFTWGDYGNNPQIWGVFPSEQAARAATGRPNWYEAAVTDSDDAPESICGARRWWEIQEHEMNPRSDADSHLVTTRKEQVK